MTHFRLLRFCALALAAALAARSLMEDAVAEGCPTACPGGKVVIGLSAPLTGSYAVFGRDLSSGMEVAVSELNAAGGLLGVKVEITMADDQCNPSLAAQAASQFVERDSVTFVMGPVCASASLASAPIYFKGHVLQILPSATAVPLTRQAYSNLFRLAWNDDQELQAVSAYLIREQRGGKRVTVVYDQTPYGRFFADGLSQAIPNISREVITPSDLADMQNVSSRLKASRTQLVYAALSAEAAARLSRVLRDQSPDAEIVSGAGLLSQQFSDIAGSAAQGTIVVAPAGTLGVRGSEGYARLAAKSNRSPDTLALAGYAAIEVWREAVRRANGGALDGVIQALRSTRFNTIIGPITFDERGDRQGLDYAVFRWGDGRFREGGRLQ